MEARKVGLTVPKKAIKEAQGPVRGMINQNSIRNLINRPARRTHPLVIKRLGILVQFKICEITPLTMRFMMCYN